ncbi:MAG TPA: GNAT family N-acetyltransferase [Verrucomicrobiae bacterium]|nr:GNAT family N-acetyltransferase [Verrucomicrobiae bacterium]
MKPLVAIHTAEIADAQAILDLQRLAFRTEAELYGDWHIPPLTEPLEKLAAEFQNHVFLKAVHTESGQIIGSVRALMEEENCLIRRLIVHPEFRNHGIGTLLMEEIERRFARAKRFQLFTGYLSRGNLHLYDRLGYTRHGEQQVTEKLRLVLLQKDGIS